MLRHFADVQQAVGSGNDFDERAEIGEARDFAEIGLPHLRGGREVADNLQRLGRRLLIARCNFDQPGILHIDLDSGLFDDRANHLAARPDQVANLIDRDLHRVEARSEVGNLLASAGDHFFHLAENVQPSALRLRQRFAHNLRSDAGHFNIHLQRGDAILRSGNFEVHIAVVIFCACDVGENGILLAFLHQSHCNARNRSLQRNARIHQRKRSPANRRHRRRSIRLQNVGHHAHRVRPRLFRRQHARNRALRQRPVPNLPAPRPAHKPNLTHRKRREIVMQHEAFFGFAFEAFEALHVVRGTERGGDQGLSFAAGEDGAAVRAGQNAGFDPDVANFVEGAGVRAAFLLQDFLAEDALAQRFVILL